MVMEEKKSFNVYEYLTSFFLPDGMLDFFEVVWVDEEALSSRELKQAVVYKTVLKVHLDERDNRTEEQQELRPNGFTEATMAADFPIRDRRVELHIRRRRWLTPEGKSVILNIYLLVADGTRYSVEFAEFLKKKLGCDPGDRSLPW